MSKHSVSPRNLSIASLVIDPAQAAIVGRFMRLARDRAAAYGNPVEVPAMAWGLLLGALVSAGADPRPQAECPACGVSIRAWNAEDLRLPEDCHCGISK